MTNQPIEGPQAHRIACAATFETPEVIGTCLLAPSHPGPHYDYGNGLRWLGSDGLGDDDALGVYCMTCSAGVGTPCSDPLGGVTPPHAARFGLARGMTMR